MMAPRVLRELSWCASKLREVARVLSAMAVRLTVDSESDSMSAPTAVGQETEAMSHEPIQLRLTTQECVDEDQADREARASAREAGWA